MDDKVYRHLLDEAFRKIDAAFADVDPDAAEVQLGQGTLTIIFPRNLRCILTPQPPVQQMWMAFRDRAWHFDWDPASRSWMDDRGLGKELFALVAEIARTEGGVTIAVKADA